MFNDYLKETESFLIRWVREGNVNPLEEPVLVSLHSKSNEASCFRRTVGLFKRHCTRVQWTKQNENSLLLFSTASELLSIRIWE